MTAMASPNLSPTPLSYRVVKTDPYPQGLVYLGGVSVQDLRVRFGTPLYILDYDTVAAMASAYQAALQAYPAPSKVLFAAKAHCSIGVCQLMTHLGLGLDLVSGGEVYTAHHAQVDLSQVVFNGNNKSDDELAYAMAHGVGFISVDNIYELDRLFTMAQSREQTVNIFLRVTPGIECHTHDYIKTGHLDSKFGFDLSQLSPIMMKMTQHYSQYLKLVGLHAHIGSQIFERTPYADVVETLMDCYAILREHFEVTLTHINVGGGLGVHYTGADAPVAVHDLVSTITQALVAACDKHQYPLPTLLMEPGRSMIATAGTTLYEVGGRKDIPELGKTYVAVDGGMGDNIRVALYGAHYSAVVANKALAPTPQTVTVAGRYCESGDILFPSLQVPEDLAPQDLLMVLGTGAYNYSMASTYNRVGRPAMVLVRNGDAQTLIQRESWADMVRHDQTFKP